MNEHVHCFPVLQRTSEGKWMEFTGRVIGTAHGGQTVTTYSTLERLDDTHLINPATQEVFHKTKSGKYFNNELRILVNVFLTEVPNDP